MIVRILEVDQKYYLSSLLMTRNYRDPVTCLPLPLALHLLSFIPVKHLLRNCSTVCSVWNERCTNEDLWQGLCTTSRLGLPGVRRGVLWREMFLESLRMKFNWWRRRCTSTSLSGHSGRVLCVRVRGDMVATGSTDATIRIWSVETGQCIQVLTGHSRGVWCLTFFGKRLLISGSIDQSIKVWNITTGVCEKTARDVHSGSIWCLQVKREVLITGSQDKTAVIWNGRSLKPRLTLRDHGGVVMSVDLSDSTSTAYTGAGDGIVREWSVENGECVRSICTGGNLPVISLSWNKEWLAWSNGDRVIVWDCCKWKKKCELVGHDNRVECVLLKVHDVKIGRGYVITSSRDRTVKYWTSGSGRLIGTLQGHTDTVNSISSNPWAIVSGSNDQTVRIWNFHSHAY